MVDILAPIKDLINALSGEVLTHSQNSTNFIDGKIKEATASITDQVDEVSSSITDQVNQVGDSISKEVLTHSQNSTAFITNHITSEITKISPDFASNNLEALITRGQVPGLIDSISKEINVDKVTQLLTIPKFDTGEYISKSKLLSVIKKLEELLIVFSGLISKVAHGELQTILRPMAKQIDLMNTFVGHNKTLIESIDNNFFTGLKIPDPLDLGEVENLIKEVLKLLESIPHIASPEGKAAFNKIILIYSPIAEVFASAFNLIGSVWPASISVGIDAGISIGVKGSGGASLTVYNPGIQVMGSIAFVLTSISTALQGVFNALENWDKTYA